MHIEDERLIPHLFRQESGKIISTLSRYWGIGHLQAAEDIAAETFLKALETWPYHGVPDNPVAWLYRVARNLSLNYLKRNHLFQDVVSQNCTSGDLDAEAGEDALFESDNIRDSQLAMLFAICQTDLPAVSQIVLALRILCGFSIGEIANALLSNKETINKRLYRAKEKLRQQAIPPPKVDTTCSSQQLEAVLTMLYLLYNEGYYSENHDQILRKDLCLEAFRLTALLTEDPAMDIPEVNALLALMSFQTSRFEARINALGEMVLYADQDVDRWNAELIRQGIYFLNKSARGDHLSKYHLEAMIAYYYTEKEETVERWTKVLELFDLLKEVD